VSTRRAWSYGFASIAVVCLLAAPVLADVTVHGDRSAFDEVIAAFTKLFSLPGFRAKYTRPQGQGGVFEYAAPNSWHIGAPGGPFEIIHVGGQVATRTDIPGQPSGWRCRASRAGDRPLFDPTKATGTYTVSRGPDTVIDGTPVHTIFSARAGRDKDTLYVGAQNGLPRRVVDAEGRNTIDYYDYGASVVITLPPCPP
jgi:hypothetical protein